LRRLDQACGQLVEAADEPLLTPQIPPDEDGPANQAKVRAPVRSRKLLSISRAPDSGLPLGKLRSRTAGGLTRQC
jgi:hypothetical protein